MNKKDKISLLCGETSLCYSDGIRYGDTLYISGQVGADMQGNVPAGIKAQTAIAIENARRLIEAAGSSLDKVLMCRCFIAKKEDFGGMNEAYSQYFGGTHNMAPARYTVVAPPVEDKYLIEIAMIVGF